MECRECFIFAYSFETLIYPTILSSLYDIRVFLAYINILSHDRTDPRSLTKQFFTVSHGAVTCDPKLKWTVVFQLLVVETFLIFIVQLHGSLECALSQLFIIFIDQCFL